MSEEIQEKKTRFSINKSASVANYIYLGDVIFQNYKKTPEVLEICNKTGYTEEKMTQAKALLDDLKAKILTKEQKLKDQLKATKLVNQKLQETYDTYIKDLTIARLAYKDNSPIKALLKLEGQRKTSFTRKLSQMTDFYNNSKTPEVIASLTDFGATAEKIDEKLQALDQLKTLDQNQEMAKQELKLATKDKEETFQNYTQFIQNLTRILKSQVKDPKHILQGVLMN